MNQLIEKKDIEFDVQFSDIKKNFKININSTLTGQQLQEEMAQMYDSNKYDILIKYQDQVLNLNKPLIDQMINKNEKIIIQLAIPISVIVQSKNKKYQTIITSQQKTKDLEEFLNPNNRNIEAQFQKKGEVIDPNLTLFEQGIQKNEVIYAHIKQVGGY